MHAIRLGRKEVANFIHLQVVPSACTKVTLPRQHDATQRGSATLHLWPRRQKGRAQKQSSAKTFSTYIHLINDTVAYMSSTFQKILTTVPPQMLFHYFKHKPHNTLKPHSLGRNANCYALAPPS